MAARGFADPKTLIENVQSGRGQYIRPYLFENLPNTRKPMLAFIIFLELITILLIIIGMLYPVPQFSRTAGLLALTASRNGTAVRMKRSLNLWSNTTGLPVYGPSLQPRKEVTRTTDSKYWDDECQCYAKTRIRYTTEYQTRTTKATLTLPDAPTQVAHSTPSASATLGFPGVTPTQTPAMNVSNPDQGDFVGLWLGVMGGCMQRKSGVLVCTSASFGPNFAAIYEEVALPANITTLLPTGTSGAPVGLLVGMVSFAVSALVYVASQVKAVIKYAPNQWVREWEDSDTPPAALDARHQWWLAIASAITTIACFATVTAVITLRNSFTAVPEAVKAWDHSGQLVASLQSGFPLLDASAVLGVIILLLGLVLIAYDLFNPWWYKKERTIWTSGQDAAIGSGGARATASVIGANTIAGSSVTGTPYTAGTPYDMPGTPYTGRR